MLDVTSKVYRKRLAQSVTSGNLEAADSKAVFLQNLCEELHFDTQKAVEIHEGKLWCNIWQLCDICYFEHTAWTCTHIILWDLAFLSSRWTCAMDTFVP